MTSKNNRTYEEQLRSISNSVLNLEEESIQFGIYQDNYLSHSIEKISSDFTALYKYLGDRNFSFFVRLLLIERNIRSPNIIDLARAFPSFLKEKFEIHQDELIADLAKIDLMWAHGEYQELHVYQGMLEYWQELATGKKSLKKINLGILEKITLVEVENERALKLVGRSYT